MAEGNFQIGDIIEITNDDTPAWARGLMRVTGISDDGRIALEFVNKRCDFCGGEMAKKPARCESCGAPNR